MTEKRLYLHTSNRAENLARRIVEVASESPLPSLLSRETVMTLNPGIARWLQFEIAKRTGVSFSWDFPLPGKLFRRLLEGFAPGFDALGAFPEALARWHLCDLLSNLEDQPRFATLRAYCQSPSPIRRLGLAGRLAKLYDEYLVYRPDELVKWEDEPQHRHWQAELWRRLLKRIYPQAETPPHIARIWSRLSRGANPIAPQIWPERLFLFGISSLAPLYLDFLDKVSQRIPVHIFLLQPSDLYWADLKTSKDMQRIVQRAASQSDDSWGIDPADWLFETGNPLLPALGKQGQMFLDLLIDRDPIQDDSQFSEPESVSQLTALQSDLFTITRRSAPSGDQPYPAYDGTLQIHRCTTKRREVETLWDYLVHRLDSSPDLHPGDIMVMAPDINQYRSHIDAVFKSKRGTSLDIPYSIADAPNRIHSSLLSGLADILRSSSEEASSRSILSLLETPLLREAFSFSDIDIESIEFWIRELGITWGWDAQDRQSHHAFGTDLGTWKELEQRLVSGLFFGNEQALPNAYLSYNELEADLRDTAGRFTECLCLLRTFREGYWQTRGISGWQQRLLSHLENLRTPLESWEQQYREAVALIREALPDLDSVFATGAEAYQAVLEKIENAPSSGGYLSGGVTFCSLKPMRSIPSDTVCVIGLNRLDFPKRNTRLSFDLLAQAPRKGDRNSREEYRQFFLETILSARSQLYLSYLGLSSSSDTVREPSVVLEELQAYLKEAMSDQDFKSIHFTQKRQSYDRDYFTSDRLYTYDADRAKLAAELHSPQAETAPAPTNSAPRELDEPIELEELISFFKDPARYFVSKVSQARLNRIEDPLPEHDKLRETALDAYLIRDFFAERLSAGESIDDSSLARFASRKRLPPGLLQKPVFTEELELAQRAAAALDPCPAPPSLRLLLLERSALSGRVQLDAKSGEQLLIFSGEMKAGRVIETWIRHLFARATEKDFCGRTLAVSLKSLSTTGNIRFLPVDHAKDVLEQLIALYLKAHSAPLPLFPEESYQSFKRVSKDSDAKSEAFEDAFLADFSSRLEKVQQGSKSDWGADWSDFDKACFGEEFLPDRKAAETAIRIWKPVFQAMETFKL
ncbi:exodeoxyribonuclease V subunit gamma [Pelagicoccus sp. SDUM812003]|uniref:exodeoxyribonuclease V subunit gamma n=1 Tax=Pelagicoccus sp. SDUM812003 TaxID=3041267 RepID=UPI00280EB32B|nr:exodeoxyribonuclease V subunit gamma [Pelagicoccus sp. SDUM812003]MDQ8201846.1 exodeoxyribonuclease V subunit gamma [Pelagicoccus sp. SDUM812003]